MVNEGQGAKRDTETEPRPADNSEKRDKPGKDFNWAGFMESLLPTLVVAGMFVFGFVSSFSSKETHHLDIYANQHEGKSMSPSIKNWIVQGHVLIDGEPVNGAHVWAEVQDGRGNKDTPGYRLTKEDGKFVFEEVPQSIGNEKITQILLYAKKDFTKVPSPAKGEEPSKEDTSKKEAKQGLDASDFGPVRGEALLSVSGKGFYRTLRIPGWVPGSLLGTFFLSVLVAFILPTRKWKYWIMVIFAFFFTFWMMVVISLGLYFVSTKGTEGEILSLGFASVFKGTYVKGVQEEWLFSFTSPGNALSKPVTADAPSNAGAPPEITVNGFGAPLWVVLIAVLGAGIFTVSVIVLEIKESATLNFADPSKVSERIEKLVRHQFFILFAPVGAIFIFQILLAGGAAEKPLTVALAVLGAGATLNVLLDKAVKKAEALIKET